MVEFEFAKLPIKRKERDEARKHLEKAIAFLQPLGDSVGMRVARALLATLEREVAGRRNLAGETQQLGAQV